MAITNYICEQCDHYTVCGDRKKAIDKFSDEAKTPLGINITLDRCSNYKEVEE